MIRYFLFPLFWAATILFLSSIPSEELPDFSFWTLLSFDKVAHAVLYGILSFQVMKSFIRQYAYRVLRYNAVRVTAVSCIIYGGLIELYQEFILTDRSGEWLDMVSNIIGTFLGIWLFRILFIQYIR